MGKIAALPAVIATERLTLRKPVSEDAEPIFRAYASDPDVTSYLTWRPHQSVEDTRGYLGYCAKEWASGTSFPYVIGEKNAPDAPIGMIHTRPSLHGFTMGYVLARTYWGRGYMTEALTRLSRFLLSLENVFRVSSFCDVDNIGSARVMEKSGMEFEGVLKRYAPRVNISDAPRDCRMYALTR